MARRLGRCLVAATVSVAAIACSAPADATMPAWILAFEQFMSGLSIQTKQRELSSRQQATATRRAFEAAAGTLVSADTNLEELRARNRFDYASGQGYAACRVTIENAAYSQAGKDARRMTSAIDEADRKWLNDGGDLRDRLGESLALRREFYCSDEERALGWCSSSIGSERGGGYAAGDSDASVFLAQRSYGTEEVLTGADYVDVVAPMPTVDSKAAGVDGAARLIANRRRAAFVSTARSTIFNVVVHGMEGAAPEVDD